MSTDTEEKKDTIPDWAIGYSLSLPCDNRTPPCDNEAEWFGNQHGCYKAHICDYHMQIAYQDVSNRIAEYGAVECRRCKCIFPTFASFIKAVRI